MSTWLTIFVTIILYSIMDTVQSRSYCYSGSNLYQLQTLDCSGQGPPNTEWYCSKMEVCESSIDPSRICVITRGCATTSQCINPSTSQPYNNELVQATTGVLPAGMTIKASCCTANSYPNDDNVAIDYSLICNNSHRTSINYIFSLSFIMGLILYHMFTF